MRGKILVEELLFDPEIERTVRRINSKTRKRRQLAKLREEQEASSSSNNQQTMAEEEDVVNNDTNIGFVNFTPRNMTRTGMTARDERPPEVKSRTVQLMYANPFAGLDLENPYTHLTKFYELFGTAGLTQAEEEAVFLRLFPLTLIGQAKDWFLDQPQETMADWNEVERKFMD